ncbi:ABC transporter substrate-binding protein [Chelatococcus reniformis]|uniref:Leucine-binding protein domain-containing protein n=1 Tax=Chelatococcus reniformis TaxID=1494448 RepID=A0A916TX20_9HYPH|nr:ABC transporter substrate-binding protein [Chelatococcus reniformis]GGC47811.1 hypothetical protein GCM10010994_03700 [Chelatococcus reniformis]
MNIGRLLSIIASASLALWAPGALAQTDTVKLGVIGSLTGPHSGWDVPASDGVQMAVSEINAAGGFKVGDKTYKFSVVQEDTQSKPDIAATAAQKLLSDEDIRFVMGVLTSTPGVPVANQMARAKVLYVGGFTAMDGLVGTKGKELLLRALDTDETAAKGFVPAAAKELGLKRVGMLLPNDDVSKSIVKIYEPLFKQNGIEVGLVELFQPGTTDFAPVLRKFQNQGLDGLFIGYSDPDAEAIIRQSLEIGGLPTKFVYRGGSSQPAAKYADKIDGFLWQILTRDLANPSDDKVKDWILRYKAFTKKEVTPQTYWALTFYDTVFMLVKAMQEAGTVTDPAAVAAKLKGMAYDGVRRMSYNGEGRAITDIDIGVLKGGKVYSIPQKIL